MTQEIIEMARDSGMELYGLGKDRARFVHHLEAFAKLVAEKALAEHAMRETQRLGQEIEQDADHFCDANCVWTDHHPDCKLAQPEQEPVAFASHGVVNWIADKQFQHEADLYTTPPQRTEIELVGTVKELFKDSAWNRLNVRGSTKVYLDKDEAAHDIKEST